MCRLIGQQNLIDLITKIDNVKGKHRKKRIFHRKRETDGWRRQIDRFYQEDRAMIYIHGLETIQKYRRSINQPSLRDLFMLHADKQVKRDQGEEWKPSHFDDSISQNFSPFFSQFLCQCNQDFNKFRNKGSEVCSPRIEKKEKKRNKDGIRRN